MVRARACVCGRERGEGYPWILYSSKNMQNVLIFHQMLAKFLIHPHQTASYVFNGIKL